MAESLAARLTRRSGTSFYYAFRILPREKREALYALYGFCRMVDDCVDEPDGGGEAGLDHWLVEARRAFAGDPATELGRELAESVRRFPMPLRCFERIVEGCRRDIGSVRFPDFASLRAYCESVASAVGLASIEIFGYTDASARVYATELGVALQLTNILRDLGSDARRGRLYLPLDELDRFGLDADEFVRRASEGGVAPLEWGSLLGFQLERAREHYARARAALPAADRRSLASAEIMGAIYRAVLETLAARRFRLSPRVQISRPRRAWIALRTLARARLA